MKKLIILSLLSFASINATAIPGKSDSIAARAARAAKNVYKQTKSYIKDTASDFSAEVQDIAQDVAAQFKEAGTDIYDATIAPVFDTTKKTAAHAQDKAKETGSKIVTATKNTYTKATNSRAVNATKQMATELKEQLSELGQTVYENGVRTPAIVVSAKAAAIAAAIKEKIIAAKDATTQAASDAKNSEFAQDMADVGTQFKEAATDASDFVVGKSTGVWDKTKATVQEIREELTA